jgi:hypothetical protein
MTSDELSASVGRIGGALDRVALHLRAEEREPARAAIAEGLRLLEHDFVELCADERAAGWLRGSLHALTTAAIWCGLDDPGTAERHARAVRLRLQLAMHHGPL